MAKVATCPKCSTSIAETHAQSWCAKCGDPLPAAIQAKLPALVSIRARAAEYVPPAQTAEPVSENAKNLAIALGVVGLLLFGLGFIRYNSAESQFLRALGQKDGGPIAMCVIGGIMLCVAISMFSSGNRVAKSRVAPAPSVADRLRRLEDLQDKQLISPSEFEQRKREILAEL